jgi:hypothetical protein
MFMLLYSLFISRKAGYTFCRRYLLVGMLLSVLIPTLNVPLYHIDTRNADRRTAALTEAAPTTQPEMVYMPNANTSIQSSQSQTVASTETIISDAGTASVSETSSDGRLHLPGYIIMKLILFFVYLAGVLISLLLILRSIIYISKIRNRSILTRRQGYTLAENADIKSPFSFLHTIFMGREYNEVERSQILSHETSHVRHHHSLEKLVMSVLRSLFWFNPFMWMAEKSLEEVQEWQADNDALSDGYDVEDYRDTVIRMLFGLSPLTTTGMGTSFTKKRLLRMNEKESTGHKLAVTALTVVLTSAMFLCFGCKAVIEEKPVNDDETAIPGYPEFMNTEGKFRKYLQDDNRMFFSINDLIYAKKGEPLKRTYFVEELNGFDRINMGLDILERPDQESLPTLVCINGYKCADFPSSKELKWVNAKTLIVIGTRLGSLEEFRKLKPEDYLAIIYYKAKSKKNQSLVYVVTSESLENTTSYNYPAIINRPDADLPDVISPGGFGVHGNYFICQDNYNIAITEHFAVDGRLVSLDEFKQVYKSRGWYSPLVFRNSQAERRFGKGILEVAELRNSRTVRVHFSNVNGLILAVINGKEYNVSELKNLSDILGLSHEIKENDPLTYVEIFADQVNNEWINDQIVELIKQYIPWDDPALIINAFRKIKVESKPTRESGFVRYTSTEIVPIKP